MSMMIELRPEAGPALIVGGGAIGLRKARNLSDGQFLVTVIAPEIDEGFRPLPFTTVIERPFEESDIDSMPPWALVFACTNNREVNRRIGELARARNIPVVVTDRQGESTFFTPATLRDGDITVAVSTGGTSPETAKKVRIAIADVLSGGKATILGRAGTFAQEAVVDYRRRRKDRP